MKDLHKKKDSELLTMLAEKTRAIQSMNFSLSKSQPGEQSIASLRKDIARIKTALNGRDDNA